MTLRRLSKLKAMRPREIAHRFAYEAFTAVERRAHDRGRLARPGSLRASLVSELRKDVHWDEALLRRTGGARFFAWEDDPQSLRDCFQTRYTDELTQARGIAEQVARHEIAFFGQTFSFGPEIDWHADPVTGAEWPRRYHRDVPVAGGDVGFGDVKYVWELNRHQFLMDLAKVAFLEKSPEYAAEVETLIRSWRAAAPPGTGVPWACALEPAFRAWSWLWAYSMLRAGNLLTREGHLRWLEGFLDHGRFLHRHLEYFSSPYNHLVGEASALFALGVLFPEFRESREWLRRGRGVLEDTLPSQFHADGGTVEQSTFYHHATLGFYMLAALLGRRNGVEFSGRVWDAIERGLEFSAALVQPDGRLPSIGGADDGKPIRLQHLPFWDFRPYYAIGAVLFKRGDFKTAAGRFPEDALWILGARAADHFAALSAAEPLTSRTLPHSGYSVFRTSAAADADYVCFDCGEQAAGLRRDDVPSAAHGHADCLAVIAALEGQPVLVDPGFYCYNGKPEWEVHFRKTPAHNTITIDGRDQARHLSKMAWTNTYLPHLEASSPGDAVGWARGSHDGYADAGRGVVHRRTVWLRPGGYLLIYDELTGRPGHVARANYQFAPGSLALVAEDSALFAGRFELSWACSVPVTATIAHQGSSPGDGWIAPSLGVRAPAPRLLLTLPLPHHRVVLVSVLADRQRASQDGRRVHYTSIVAPQTDPTIGVTVEGAGWEDRLVAAHGGRTIQWAGIETDAAVAVVRSGMRGTEDSRRIGGSFVRVGEPQEPEPIAAREPLARAMI
jgi:hypothetical protein